MNNVIKFLKSLNIWEDEKIVLACSYGPDSMALLDILNNLGFTVVVAHVNHKLRKEADEEEKKLKKYCESKKIIFESTTITSYGKGNVEAYARNFRYNYFKEIISKYKSRYLFTAHHGDDLIETVIMKIARGATLSSYAGFKKITNLGGYSLVRPLIYLTKEEIIKYNEENNIPYAIDKTNLECDLTRNKCRHKILPILKEINPEIHNKFIKFSNNISESSDFIDREVNKVLKEVYVLNSLDLNNFYLLDDFIKRKVIEKILLDIYKDSISLVTDKHVQMIIDLSNNSKANCFINLPGKKVIVKFYNKIIFDYKPKDPNYEYILTNEISHDDWKLKIVSESEIKKSNYVLRIRNNDVVLPLIVRNRKIGDKITLKNGTKKVGEILSEKKMSINERNKQPLVCDSSGKVLWLPGIKKSKYDSNFDDCYDIIIKYVKKERNNEKEK